MPIQGNPSASLINIAYCAETTPGVPPTDDRSGTYAVTAHGTELLSAGDVDTIAFVQVDPANSANGIVRYTFTGTPDLSNIAPGDSMAVASSTGGNHDGTFAVTAVNKTGYSIDVSEPGQLDGTDDEASPSPATGTVTTVGDRISVAAGVNFDNISAGQEVILSGFADAQNNGGFDVVSIDKTNDPYILVFNEQGEMKTAAGATATVGCPPIYQGIPVWGGSLTPTNEMDESAGQIVRDDLQVKHNLLTGLGNEGTIEGKLYAGTPVYDFLESAMTNNNGWTAQQTQSGLVLTVAVVNPGPTETYTVTANAAGDGWTANFSVGQFIRINGAEQVGLNRNPYLKITDINTTGGSGTHKITVENGSALTAETISSATVIRAKTLRNGTVKKTFSFLQDYYGTEGDPVRERFSHVLANGFELSTEIRNSVGLNFPLLPAGERDWNPQSDDTLPAHVYHGGLAADPVVVPYVGATTLVKEDNALRSVESLSITVADRYEAINATKNDVDENAYYPVGSRPKPFEITGSATIQFTDTSFMERFERQTSFSLDKLLREKDDDTGKAFIFSIPNARLTNYSPDAAAFDAVRNLSVDFRAAEYVNTDSDGNSVSFMLQVSVFE